MDIVDLCNEHLLERTTTMADYQLADFLLALFGLMTILHFSAPLHRRMEAIAAPRVFAPPQRWRFKVQQKQRLYIKNSWISRWWDTFHCAIVVSEEWKENITMSRASLACLFLICFSYWTGIEWPCSYTSLFLWGGEAAEDSKCRRVTGVIFVLQCGWIFFCKMNDVWKNYFLKRG